MSSKVGKSDFHLSCLKDSARNAATGKILEEMTLKASVCFQVAFDWMCFPILLLACIEFFWPFCTIFLLCKNRGDSNSLQERKEEPKLLPVFNY